MDQDQITELCRCQREFFAAGATLDPDFRRQALGRLYDALEKSQDLLSQALYEDLGKPAQESYFCEIGLCLSEIRYLSRHVGAFAREKTVPTPLSQFRGRSFRKWSPYGLCLIMSPWNYPVLLTLEPLAAALAAGNTAIVKPSAYAPATAQALKTLVGSVFPREHAAVVLGGRQENACLLEERFDHIFFTGSRAVGQLVLQKAARHLTPVTLELGGKSPCIVHQSADLSLAARRIVFGKLLNCGQTCVAPDYILCHSSVKGELVEQLIRQIRLQYGPDPLHSDAWGRMVSRKHFDRVVSLIDREKTVFGGGSDPDRLKIEPTLLDGVGWEDPVMGEEIFGPVLPIMTYEDLEEVIRTVNSRPSPLALYLFARDRKAVRLVTDRCVFGGGCVNDCVVHLASSHLPFGGVGESGMGAYHGKASLETFSHCKGILEKKSRPDLPMRYQPYDPHYDTLIRKILR